MRAIRISVATAATLFASTALAQNVTGQWDFDNPADGLAATVGQDGSYWTLPIGPPPRDIRTETQFGTPASFGIPGFPGGGSGGVMRFPDNDQRMGYAMYPNTPANGGGAYVNQYTVIYDVLYPAASSAAWRALLQTNECNTNDGDIFINTANGLGISGNYVGTVNADTWHRIAVAFDLSTSTLDKYIDGVLVGSQTLGEGLDGRWALYTDTDNLPTLIFSDNDGDTRVGYCSSVQFRNYYMSGAEIAALGGVTAGNIPGGAGVTGQWDFENAADGLNATVGRDLDWFDGTGCFDLPCDQDISTTTLFGLTGGSDPFDVPNLPDGPAGVMYWEATIPCQGYLFPHGAEANGGGVNVNDYTLIMDIYIRGIDYFVRPPGHDPGWIALYQTNPRNTEDAMYWIRTEDGALGDDAVYAGTEFWALEDRWMRLVLGVNGSDPTGTKVYKYVLYTDDSMLGPVVGDMAEPVDGKRSLRTNETAGTDFFLAFADESQETSRGHISSLQIRDYVMTTDEVLALGGPRAAGIPRPPAGCSGDLDGDNDRDISDLAILLSQFGSTGGTFSADVDDDGDVDISDLAIVLSVFGIPC